MNSKSIALILGVLAIMTIATTAVLAKADHPQNIGKLVNNHGVPEDSKLILNVNYKVKNDQDSKVSGGYWALDDYMKHVQVWQLPDDTFYAVVRYQGKWHTFAGALSPQANLVESKDATGTFHGGYIATFTGTFAPGDKKTHGFIGIKDFGGTKENVLGGIGAPDLYNVFSDYFSGYANFVQPIWGWTYHYRGQTWNNFYSGNSGDIAV